MYKYVKKKKKNVSELRKTETAKIKNNKSLNKYVSVLRSICIDLFYANI